VRLLLLLLLLLLSNWAANRRCDLGRAPSAGADCLGNFFMGRGERDVHLQPHLGRRYTMEREEREQEY
jgi:hypothetical protein